MVVPSSKTEIQATNEGSVKVDYDELLVVSPVEGHIGRILEDIVIGMSHDNNIAVSRSTLWA